MQKEGKKRQITRVIKYSVTLSTIINRLFSLATVQIPVVVNLPATAML